MNLYGLSNESLEGGQAIIPSVPSQPLYLVETSQERSKDSIGIEWTAPSESNGFPVQGYVVSISMNDEDYKVVSDSVIQTNYVAKDL